MSQLSRCSVSTLAVVLLAGTLSAQTLEYKVVHSFLGETDGRSPISTVILDKVGNIYGSSMYGGVPSGSSCGDAYMCGVVFKLDTSGSETVLYTFSGLTDGGQPIGTLVRDKEDNLYGATASGGNLGTCFGFGCGNVFKVDPSGTETIVEDFLTGSVNGGIIGDSGGNFLGTHQDYGPGPEGAGYGQVFQLTPAGVETILYQFVGPPGDGSLPSGSLIRDRSGNLYGVTSEGGAYSFGTVFKLDHSGAERLLFSFDGHGDGGVPTSGLVEDEEGNLYGVTSAHGKYNQGVVFKVSQTGTEMVLHAFTGAADGGAPAGPLIRDTAGNLYGTASVGGQTGNGVVFKFNLQGDETVLYNFRGVNNGVNPNGGLTFGRLPTGTGYALYGPAYGGAADNGIVFRLTLPADVQPADVQPENVQPGNVQPENVQPENVQPGPEAGPN